MKDWTGVIQNSQECRETLVLVLMQCMRLDQYYSQQGDQTTRSLRRLEQVEDIYLSVERLGLDYGLSLGELNEMAIERFNYRE